MTADVIVPAEAASNTADVIVPAEAASNTADVIVGRAGDDTGAAS